MVPLFQYDVQMFTLNHRRCQNSLRRIIPAQRAGRRRGQDYKYAIWTRKAVLSESTGLYRLSLQIPLNLTFSFTVSSTVS